ncbi:unnamed protein product, partial [Callosobruchus maculatus]
AIKCLLKAAGLESELGRLTLAGKHHQTVAELYENEEVDYENAVSHYEQAAVYFCFQDEHALANHCLEKVAHYAVYYENYEKGLRVYKELARRALKNNHLLYNTKEYFFKAALCDLAISVASTRQALEVYCRLYPGFKDTREYDLLLTLMGHIELQNVEGYEDTLRMYDSISRLNQFYIINLLRIKKRYFNSPILY